MSEVEAAEEWFSCPYNRGHVSPASRFYWHITRCPSRKQNESLHDKCAYNASHVIVKGKVKDHHFHCADNPDVMKKEGSQESQIDLEIQKYLNSKVSNVEPEKKNSSNEADVEILTKKEECMELDMNVSNLTNNDPDVATTNCRSCRAMVEFIAPLCKVCFLQNPQISTEKDKAKLYRGNEKAEEGELQEARKLRDKHRRGQQYRSYKRNTDSRESHAHQREPFKQAKTGEGKSAVLVAVKQEKN